MARPSDYDPAYCEKVIELGKEGCSVVEMAAEIGVSRNTLETNWPEKHPEFLEAFTRARLLSQAWWEQQGRKAINKGSSEFNASVWSRSMAARFPHDWREVKGTELTGKDGAPIETRTETKLDVANLNDEQLRALASIRVPTE
ncbi:MAG: hypothetical protein ABGX08_17370 [Citromicrobium sp.]